MKKPMKAVLLSAFVYPGMGHFILKKNMMCITLIITFSVPLYFIISEIFIKAEQIVEQVKNGEIPLDITAISESLSNSVAGADTQELNIKVYVLVIVWLVGIVDSYRVGHSKT